jgi:hypothetical protein
MKAIFTAQLLAIHPLVLYSILLVQLSRLSWVGQLHGLYFDKSESNPSETKKQQG